MRPFRAQLHLSHPTASELRRAVLWLPRAWRNRAARICLLGFFLTLLVAALDRAGKLATIEGVCYDLRARHCLHFIPPPTDQLVHLDIDDSALETVGPWPWPRTTLAE